MFCLNAIVWHYNANGRIVTVSLVKFAHRLQYVFNAVRPSNVANFNCARFVQYIGYANNWSVNFVPIRLVSLIIRIHLHIFRTNNLEHHKSRCHYDSLIVGATMANHDVVLAEFGT